MCCVVVLRAGDVAMVVRFLGVPALAGEAVFCSGDFPSVVLTTAVYTVLCKETSTDTSHYLLLYWSTVETLYTAFLHFRIIWIFKLVGGP